MPSPRRWLNKDEFPKLKHASLREMAKLCIHLQSTVTAVIFATTKHEILSITRMIERYEYREKVDKV